MKMQRLESGRRFVAIGALRLPLIRIIIFSDMTIMKENIIDMDEDLKIMKRREVEHCRNQGLITLTSIR